MRIPLQRRAIGTVRRRIEDEWRKAGMTEEEVREASSHLVIVYATDGCVAVCWDPPGWGGEWRGAW
jgi:hypothetical protein